VCLSSFAALLISECIVPLDETIFFIIFCNFLISNKLHSINVGLLNFFLSMIFINFFESFTFISTKYTSLSCSQKCSTIEAPIPEPPPVIKILLFFKS